MDRGRPKVFRFIYYILVYIYILFGLYIVFWSFLYLLFILFLNFYILFYFIGLYIKLAGNCGPVLVGFSCSKVIKD